MTAPIPIAILASGEGTNLQALIDAIGAGRLAASIRLVLSDRATAPALQRAARAGIPAHVIVPSATAETIKLLRSANVALVCLAGYMRILPPEMIAAYPDRIINIHPALLPAFPGLHAIRQALQAGARVTGCTVHFVDTGIDTGPIILQERVPIAPDDTEASLTAKIHRIEHQLYPKAIQLFAEGRLPSSRQPS